ncbi:MAG: hypothetical protein DCC58_01550 [Chloroflexi bacterium]|nr:MAG: hypothetical protein DCC58_01550 [Chloroflexota bacterium]
MLGSLSEFTLAQLLQLFALAERSGTITLHSGALHTRLLIESDRVIGIGATGDDLREEILSLELLPQATRNALLALSPRPDTPGLSLLLANIVDPACWSDFIARRFEQDVYPLLNADEGAFEATVERCPPAVLQVSATVQQLILDHTRWEAESEALRSSGYHLDGRWQRTSERAISEPAPLTRAMWLTWCGLREASTLSALAQRVGLPDLSVATAIKHLHAHGLVARAP